MAHSKEKGSSSDQKQIPRTLDNTRGPDVTAIDDPNNMDPEVSLSFDADEFSSYFSGTTPKIIVTTSKHPSKFTRDFAMSLANVFGKHALYVVRKGSMAIFLEEALEKKYTDVAVIGERGKRPYSLVLTHLPDGPTAYFRVSSVSNEIEGHGCPTDHVPELNMTNFNTMLGLTIGRFLSSLFPTVPQFRGRQVVTFHNQRDFIFFRRHRYIFEDDAEGVRMQELGPRFTLKLQGLQKGVFQPSCGDFIWTRHGANVANPQKSSRKQFYF